MNNAGIQTEYQHIGYQIKVWSYPNENIRSNRPSLQYNIIANNDYEAEQIFFKKHYTIFENPRLKNGVYQKCIELVQSYQVGNTIREEVMSSEKVVVYNRFIWNKHGICLNPIEVFKHGSKLWEQCNIRIAESEKGWGYAIIHYNGGSGVGKDGYSKFNAQIEGIKALKEYGTKRMHTNSMVKAAVVKKMLKALKTFEHQLRQPSLF